MYGRTCGRIAVMALRLVAVGAPAAMPRMRGDTAGVGTSMCVCPTLRIVSRACRYGWA